MFSCWISNEGFWVAEYGIETNLALCNNITILIYTWMKKLLDKVWCRTKNAIIDATFHCVENIVIDVTLKFYHYIRFFQYLLFHCYSVCLHFAPIIYCNRLILPLIFIFFTRLKDKRTTNITWKIYKVLGSWNRM